MKISNIKYLAIAATFGMSLTSCSDFLDKPVVDSYNTDNYYQNDAQCLAGVNYLYNSPWYDFQRGFIKVGEVLSGNYYWGSSPYLTFTVNGTDQDLVNMSYSLWAVIGHANTVYDNIKAGKASDAVKSQCLGECLTWKAMAYFFLVRSFGEIPIVHSNAEELAGGTYNKAKKIKKADVYDYIVLTLKEAIEELKYAENTLKYHPAEGRITLSAAQGLLAKVYLTKAGVSGSLNQADLDEAVSLATEVFNKQSEGLTLMEEYSDVFKLANNTCRESLIAWRWTVGAQWTCQNTLQSDLATEGMDENGDCWGGWAGCSVDLQEAFGVKLLEAGSMTDLQVPDKRRAATMMMAGDVVPYLWQDKQGLNYLRFIYDGDYNESATGVAQSPTGANVVKHLYGNNADHIAGCGVSAGRMANSLATHLLRISDVYLVLAEASLGASRTATPSETAKKAYNAVLTRAGLPEVNTFTWEDVWKQRRLELAMEGDRWYDYVRVSYYDPEFCVNELTKQKRNSFWGIDNLYKAAFEGSWKVDPSKHGYDAKVAAPNVIQMMKTDPDSKKMYFFMPFPTEDVLFNPNLASDVDGEHVDVSKYKYESNYPKNKQ